MAKIIKKLQNTKKLKLSSQKWLLRQMNDEYTQKAKAEGFRSRASYKIIEIDEKFKIFKKNKIIVDLGAAPGGWSQYALSKVGENNIIAIDLLEIEKIIGVNFLQLDFFEENSHQIIINELKKIPYNKYGKCNVVMSDMAANTTGDKKTDHLRIINLVEESIELAIKILKNNGVFIAKIFQGGSSDEIIKNLKNNFLTVKYFKPKSSRKDSSETYLIAQGFEPKYEKLNVIEK
jgi:23S rRNA (uridine2552-2'-O)-methyltransferase